MDAIATLIRQQRQVTSYDPPKVACAFNAGSLSYDPSPTNRRRMRQRWHGMSLYTDYWITFFNDAFGLLSKGREKYEE